MGKVNSFLQPSAAGTNTTTTTTVTAAGKPLDQIIDESAPPVTYLCFAPPGTDADAAGWLVQKMENIAGVTTLRNANGGEFVSKASDRATLNYGENVSAPPPVEEGEPPPPPPPADAPNTLALVKADMGNAATVVRSTSYAGIRAASTATIRKSSHPSTSIPNFADQVNNILAWAWVWPNVDDTSTNTAVQLRYGEVYILRLSTNSWSRLYKGRPNGKRSNLSKSGGGETGVVNGAVTLIDAETSQVRPYMTNTTVGSERYEVWELWTPSSTLPVFGNDVKAVFCTVQARLALINGGGTDDRAASRFFVQQGFDFWYYPNDGKGMKQDINFNPIEFGGYPRKQLDGGTGKLKQVTNNWQAFNFISIQPTTPSGWGPPWATWESGTLNPWQYPPYVMTVAELDANPPPLNNYLNP